MPKRMLQGTVVSDKQDKTVVLRIKRRFDHPVMKKTVRRTKNYHAHDEANASWPVCRNQFLLHLTRRSVYTH